ncbi:hypothetical protein [Engelhardtia mirabilis]|uniref:Uncharacterized protein n=1 Tax=Engelhardtia mirabilis TaxID=2528011 RepID=A0A518BEI3_9BACT|nr:hypothetical protein Pla133_04550 [Planctomycetes bacterium Pla133]QDU99716.1 hypothetical protein Pla86_04550 [Planctomycetes bacterium Pla86]
MLNHLNPLEWTEATWSAFFWVMAAWNFALALPALFKPTLGVRILFGFARDDSLSRAQQQLVSLGILVFGVAYALVALDPGSGAGLVRLGIIGKLTVLAAFAVLHHQGRATKIALAMVLGDGLWSVFFGLFLLRSTS